MSAAGCSAPCKELAYDACVFIGECREQKTYVNRIGILVLRPETGAVLKYSEYVFSAGLSLPIIAVSKAVDMLSDLSSGRIAVYLPMNNYGAGIYISDATAALYGANNYTARKNQKTLSHIRGILERQNLEVSYKERTDMTPDSVCEYLDAATELVTGNAPDCEPETDAVFSVIEQYAALYSMDISVPPEFFPAVRAKATAPGVKFSIDRRTVSDLKRFYQKEKPTISDYTRLKTYGKDDVSKLRLDGLLEAVNPKLQKNLLPTVQKYLSDDSSVRSCIRWFLRGLKLEDAIKKTLLDQTMDAFCCEYYVRDLGDAGERFHWLFPDE